MTSKLIAVSARQSSAAGKSHPSLLELIDAYAEARVPQDGVPAPVQSGLVATMLDALRHAQKVLNHNNLHLECGPVNAAILAARAPADSAEPVSTWCDGCSPENCGGCHIPNNAAAPAQAPSQLGGFSAGDMASAAAQGYRDGWAAHVQNPAEVEHVAGDVSKNGTELNMSTQPVAQQGAAYAALPEPLEIDWPELHSQALGCGVEDRGLHSRYECAEYGWQDGVDKCAERVPEQIFDADQMCAFADATHTLRIASHGQAPAQPATGPTWAALNHAWQKIGCDAAGMDWGAFTKAVHYAPTPQADSVLEDAERLLALEAAANQIFNNPPSETSQDVRDVIEWFSGSIRVVLDAAIKQGATK